MNIHTEPISNSLFDSLKTKIKELQVNPVHKNLVQKKLSKSLEQWSKKIPLTNHLVITDLPVENLEKICRQSLDNLTLYQFDENVLQKNFGLNIQKLNNL